MSSKNNNTNAAVATQADKQNQLESLRANLRRGHVFNCAGQQIHEDSKILLNDEDKHKFGGARFVDAYTFIRQNPQKYIGDTFVLGLKAYEGGTLHLTAVDKAAFKHNIPDVYFVNGWKTSADKAA